MPNVNRRHLKLPSAQFQVFNNRLRHCPPLIFGQGSAQSLDRRSGQGKSDIEG
jgi:hypothetical protein